MGRGKRRSRKFLIWARGVPLVIFVGALVWGAVWFREHVLGPDLDLDAEMAAARGEGIALSKADLALTPWLRADQNAAGIYAGIRGIKQPKFNSAVSKVRKGMATKAEEAGVRAEIAAMKAPLALILEASKRPGFDPDWSTISEGVHELGPFRALSSYLEVRAILSARVGKFESAFADLRALLVLGRHWASLPDTWALATADKFDRDAFEGLQEVLVLAAGNPRALLAAEDVFKGLPPLGSIKRTLEGDLVYGLQWIDKMKAVRAFIEYGDDFVDEPGFLNPAMPESIRRNLKAKVIRNFRVIIRRLPNDPDDWEGIGAAMEKSENVESRAFLDRFAAMAGPWSSRIASARPCMLARTRVALTALRILRIRATTGAFPSSIPKGPESIDPFTGAPLVYDPVGLGFQLRSLGDDKKREVKAPSGGYRSSVTPGVDLVFEFP